MFSSLLTFTWYPHMTSPPCENTPTLYRNRQTAMSDGAQTVRGMGVLCVKLTKYRLVGSDEE